MVTSNLIETLVKLTWFLFVLFMATPGLGQLLYGLPSEVKTAVRRFEKCSLKITRANCSVAYNNTCLRENILPKYSNIYIYIYIYI